MTGKMDDAVILQGPGFDVCLTRVLPQQRIHETGREGLGDIRYLFSGVRDRSELDPLFEIARFVVNRRKACLGPKFRAGRGFRIHASDSQKDLSRTEGFWGRRYQKGNKRRSRRTISEFMFFHQVVRRGGVTDHEGFKWQIVQDAVGNDDQGVANPYLTRGIRSRVIPAAALNTVSRAIEGFESAFK